MKKQPKTDAEDLAAAVVEFEAALPDWWWTVGVCSVSRDASCGPDLNGRDAHLLEFKHFDSGFHHDDRTGTVANSLRIVMKYALESKDKVQH